VKAQDIQTSNIDVLFLLISLTLLLISAQFWQKSDNFCKTCKYITQNNEQFWIGKFLKF